LMAHGQGFFGELAGDSQDLERAQVSGLVEQEVDRPGLVGARCVSPGRRDGRGPDSVALLGTPQHPETLVTAQTLDPLVVDTEPLVFSTTVMRR
jgi:hypothetical protein